MSGGFIEAYRAKIAAGEILSDPAQDGAIQALARLYDDLTAARVEPEAEKSAGFWPFLRKAPPAAPMAARGIYLHGAPGRGKSMLMDLFFRTLPEDIGRRRVHFHAFMIEVHDFIHARRKAGTAGVDSALPVLAREMAEALRVLCLDEFLVTDVADAMILERLFSALFEAGLAVVTTSNFAPENLYEGGLQRDRFEPFIAQIMQKMDVVALEGATDYRTLYLEREGTYFWPLGAASQARADALFAALTGHAPVHETVVEVKGRRIVIPCVAGGVARLSFSELCEQPHGAEDFLKIAGAFHTVFLEGVPILGAERRNEARRLILLIDALYDKAVRLVVTAEAAPENLYRGHDHAFEFSRTISRLNEMGTHRWLEKSQEVKRIHA